MDGGVVSYAIAQKMARQMGRLCSDPRVRCREQGLGRRRM
jgi:hypothetical protein